MLKRESLQKSKVIDHSESYWQTRDGLELYSQTWTPAIAPKGIIHIIHGLGEHSGRYSDWASMLADEGYLVRSFDHRGHGRSPGKRGHVSQYSKVIDDIGLFVQRSREEYPSLPMFLYGQSLGGNFVLNYAIKSLQAVEGLIVTSPWLELQEEPSRLMLMMVTFLSKFFPGFQVHNRIHIEDLSRDLRVVHNYKTDPLVHDRISLRFFTQCYQAGLKASMSIYKINSPLLIMHGSEDNVTSCKASRKFVQNASSKTRFVEWEGSYHELHNDLEREPVFETIRDWLAVYANPETKQNA